jgi:hypothetical protein
MGTSLGHDVLARRCGRLRNRTVSRKWTSGLAGSRAVAGGGLLPLDLGVPLFWAPCRGDSVHLNPTRGDRILGAVLQTSVRAKVR